MKYCSILHGHVFVMVESICKEWVFTRRGSELCMITVDCLWETKIIFSRVPKNDLAFPRSICTRKVLFEEISTCSFVSSPEASCLKHC